MLRGSCYCKAVKYESEGTILRFVNCHCPDCRKLSGATYATYLMVDAGGFRVVAGEDVLRYYETSPGKKREFCGMCGTHLFRRAVATDGSPAMIIIRAGTLDNDPGIEPEADIWTNYKAPWHHIPAGARQLGEGLAQGK